MYEVFAIVEGLQELEALINSCWKCYQRGTYTLAETINHIADYQESYHILFTAIINGKLEYEQQ